MRETVLSVLICSSQVKLPNLPPKPAPPRPLTAEAARMTHHVLWPGKARLVSSIEAETPNAGLYRTKSNSPRLALPLCSRFSSTLLSKLKVKQDPATYAWHSDITAVISRASCRTHLHAPGRAGGDLNWRPRGLRPCGSRPHSTPKKSLTASLLS